MGCVSPTAHYNYSGTSHTIRCKMDVRQADIAEFHTKYILDQKIVQGSFGQINLAHKVIVTDKNERHSFVDSLRRSFGMRTSDSMVDGINLARLSDEAVEELGQRAQRRRSSSRDSKDSKRSGSKVIVDYTAVKVVDLRMKGKKVIKVLQNEINFWQNLKHEAHVMELKKTYTSSDLCYMVMEACSGSLLSYLSGLRHVNERTLGYCFSQMLMGIKFLDECNVVHRNVRPDSFLVGVEGDKATIKICEFTLAQISPPGVKLNGETGSPLFMSPEMASNSGYTTRTDVWSFGVIVYALLFGRFPFDYHEKDSHDMKLMVGLMAEPISFRSNVKLSVSCLAFVMALLEKDPNIRPPAYEALEKTYMIEVITEQHMLGEKTADLRPMLDEVRKVRAFEYHEATEKSAIDDVLNRHQLAKHGIPLPGLNDVPLVIGGASNAKARTSAQKLQKRHSFNEPMDLLNCTMKIGQENSVTNLDKLDGTSQRHSFAASSSLRISVSTYCSDSDEFDFSATLSV